MAEPYASRSSHDSHDLSLSPRNVTRDSLVNNMLLSLDEFSLGQKAAGIRGTSHAGPPPLGFDAAARTWIDTAISINVPGSSGAADHRHRQYHYQHQSGQYEYRQHQQLQHHHHHHRRHSSDSDFYAAQVSTSPPDRIPRDRRSDSSPALGSSEAAARAQSRDKIGIKEATGDTRAPPSGFRHWAPHDESRSPQSLAQGTPRGLQQGLQQQLSGLLLSPFRVEFPADVPNEIDSDNQSITNTNSNDFDPDDYPAAPTPAVPGGPRRVPSAIHIPPSSSERDQERSSSRSVKGRSPRRKRAAPLELIAPAMPLADFDAAPSPSVSYGKSKAEQAWCPSPTTPPQPREKQGFFRRVFGSKNASSATPMADPQPPLRHVSASLQQVSSNTKSMGTPSLRDASSSHSNHHPPLQKKPSSFFRRYKRTNADEPPPLPADILSIPPRDGSVDSDRGYRRSPSNSLSQAMTPYLRNGFGMPPADRTNTASGSSIDNDDDRELKRDFSPGYEPHQNAKIRAVTSDSDHDPTWGIESPPFRSDRAYDKRSRSFLDLGSGSDNGDFSPRRLPREFMRRGREGEEAADASHFGSRDHDATVRPGQRRAHQTDRRDHDDLTDDLMHLKLSIPSKRSTSFASGSTETDYKTAPSAPPSVRIEVMSNPSLQKIEPLDLNQTTNFDEPEIVLGEPTEDDRLKAQQIYDGAEDFISKEKAASWIGEEGSIRQRTLKAYIELFDFTDLSIVNALRKVCSRLILRAETQQVDRILVAFSKRWCECNPTHGFKTTDVIHTICYSIMLLNTDLHIADIEQKMTRSQFVKNTLGTIMQAVAESAPDAFERPSILPEKNAFLNGETVRPSTEHDKRSFRNSFRPSARNDAVSWDMFDEAGPLVKTPFYGTMKAWEEQIEIVLKLTYASIKEDRLPLFGAESDGKHANNATLQGNLSVMGMLKRSPSVLSKAPSESFMSTRGRIADGKRNSGARWTSKNRSKAGLGRTGFSSSRTSFDDAGSIWSPAMSSATWSRYSLGRTQASMSQDSLGSTMFRGDYQQSIGFANALSQAIIRNEDASGHDGMSIMSADVAFTGPMLEDESLELSGPPWVKEGRVMHKHHLDGTGKRAKDRNWTEVFAVVQKGQMSLFSFNAPKSLRQKGRGRNAGKLSGPVGGGNWQDNAVDVGTFNLRLSLASALPSPGYSRTRPFVWALSLPTGAVHLFQVGTPEIIKEFVDTANYWSARLSSHPLVGGISNVEYGWGESVVDASLAIESSAASIASGRTSRPSSSATHGRKLSVQSVSLYPTLTESGASMLGGRGKLPGDRIHISGWSPPTQSMRPSNLLEIEQLETLASYVRGLEEELQTHNRLRSPMLQAFTPKSSNVGKAMANWERKSAYLLREIVKFNTYVDALQQASNRKREIYKERDLARRAARGELTDADMELSGAEDGDETLRPR